MNELKVINEQEVLGKHFRIYGTVEQPFFLAKDVAVWIEHSDVSTMLRKIDEDEKIKKICEANNVCTTSKARETQEMWFLTEDGLYEVLMQSRKPIAKKFKKEVKEILKSIRKHGAYMTNEVIERTLTDPDYLIQLATVLKEERQARLLAEKMVEEQKEIIMHKQNVIEGLVDEVPIYKKPEIINRICKKSAGGYASRYNELYKCFKENFHIDLIKRCENYNEKQLKKKDRLSVIRYAEKFDFIDDLYTCCVKLYETEVRKIIEELNMIQDY